MTADLDYPGRVRIVVDEDDGETQLGLLWGIRSRFYDSAATAALAYEAEALTPLDAAAGTALAGASGGTVVRHGTLSTAWTPVLSTQMLAGSAHLTHRGSYRVWARCYSTSANPPRVRFLYGVGDFSNPRDNQPRTIPVASNFYQLDLGEIRIDAPAAGTHRWQGVIQGQGAAGGENLSVDTIAFQPVDDGAGRLVGGISPDFSLAGYVARDEFNQTSGNLAGKVAPMGGTWAGAGDADDFAVETTGATAQRTATGDTAGSHNGRFATFGTPSPAAVAVQADIKHVTFGDSGVVARYTDTSNWVIAHIVLEPIFTTAYLAVHKRVAGTTTQLGTTLEFPGRASNVFYTVRFAAFDDGKWYVWFDKQGGPLAAPVMNGHDSALATGGALASGKVGIWDWNGGGAATRNIDNVRAWVPSVDAAVFANRSVELRTDGVFRQDTTGAAYTPVVPIGALPRIPPSGLENRKVELFVKASRGDFDQTPDSGIDDLSARVHYRPSWLIVPGS